METGQFSYNYVRNRSIGHNLEFDCIQKVTVKVSPIQVLRRNVLVFPVAKPRLWSMPSQCYSLTDQAQAVEIYCTWIKWYITAIQASVRLEIISLRYKSFYLKYVNSYWRYKLAYSAPQLAIPMIRDRWLDDYCHSIFLKTYFLCSLSLRFISSARMIVSILSAPYPPLIGK